MTADAATLKLIRRIAEADVQIEFWTKVRASLAAELQAEAGWSDDELAEFLADAADTDVAAG